MSDPADRGEKAKVRAAIDKLTRIHKERHGLSSQAARDKVTGMVRRYDRRENERR